MDASTQNLIGNIFLVGLFLFLGTMYLINLKRLINDLREKNYTIKTGVRIIGVFTFVVGVLMGFIQ